MECHQRLPALYGFTYLQGLSLDFKDNLVTSSFQASVLIWRARACHPMTHLKRAIYWDFPVILKTKTSVEGSMLVEDGEAAAVLCAAEQGDKSTKAYNNSGGQEVARFEFGLDFVGPQEQLHKS